MSGLTGWAALACSAAVVCTLLYRLFPDTSLGRQGRMVLPAVFLCVLLTPLTTVSLDLPESSVSSAADTDALETRVRQQTVAQVQGVLLDMVNQALASYGYTAEKVVADMDIAEDGSIHMGQITVYVKEEAYTRSSLVKQVAQKRLGADVQVVLWKEYGG